MRIQHNILAMNAYRNYNTNTSALAKNLEKLSSGYKINRAGDDAAGLAISEKMRAQITGLSAAQKNVKDGISLVKTAEGAMQEIQDMLNRMDYLATQSANGTYDNEVDRANLQKEVDALSEEIDRIANSANFNGIKLLNGERAEAAGGAGGAGSTPVASTIEFTSVQEQTKQVASATGAFSISLDGMRITASKAVAANATIGTISIGSATFKVTVKAAAATGAIITGSMVQLAGAASTTIGGVKFKADLTKMTFTASKAAMAKATAGGEAMKLDFDIKFEIKSGIGVATTTGHTITGKPEVISNGVKADKGQVGQASFEFKADMAGDGAQITIGTAGSVFTIDYEHTMASADTGCVGVKDLLVDGKLDDKKLAEVADRLSKVAGQNNSMFTIGVNGTKITVTQKEAHALSSSQNDQDTLYNGEADFKKYVTYIKGKDAGDSGSNTAIASGPLMLQVGDTADGFNQLKVKIGDMHVAAMGKMGANGAVVSGKSIADIDISTASKAAEAIDVIKSAINYVSSVRGDLGATQNRLEHTANNLSVMAENIQDAESTIRDTDVAEEMMAYTKNNILIQSAQAMLAQANAVPQGVLQLLG